MWLIIAVENRNSRSAVVVLDLVLVLKYWSSSSSSSITSRGCHGLIIAGEKEVVGCNSQATWVAFHPTRLTAAQCYYSATVSRNRKHTP